MPGILPTFLLFCGLCAAAAAGYWIKSSLPERHRSHDALELVPLTVNLLVTFTAIVLGLLTSSVKGNFDAAYNQRGLFASSLIEMDQCLRDYGPAADPIRAELRSYTAGVIASTWPDETPPQGVPYPNGASATLTGESHALGALISDIGRQIRALQPSGRPQEQVQSACAQQHQNLVTNRWRVIELTRASFSSVFYWVLVLWLVILFVSIGLTAAPNPATMIVIVLSSISITSAVFVIQDLEMPYGGLFGIPSASMRDALADMLRPG